MEQHNRKSYLGPPAPKSLRDTQTPNSNSTSSPVAAPTPSTIGKPPPISKSSRTPQQSPYPSNSASGDIPLKIANDDPSNPRYYNPQIRPQPQSSHYYSSSRSTRSPAPPSLEHLSLETNDDDDIRSGRRQMRQPLGDPISAVDAPSRPFMSPRSASSNNSNPRTNLHAATLPLRAAPPNGPPPPPPVSVGGNWRSQPGATSR
jgi:mitogen-activated protein kinase kinase